ncbi:MAG TPA: hypothetical protein VF524_04565 [Polyangia bacterium]
MTLALGALAAFVTWGRYRKAPIAAKTSGANERTSAESRAPL